MITGFCTAINPIDFTLWTSIVLLVGMMIGILLSSIFRFFIDRLDQNIGHRKNLVEKSHYQQYYPMEMDFCDQKVRRRSPEKEQWTPDICDHLMKRGGFPIKIKTEIWYLLLVVVIYHHITLQIVQHRQRIFCLCWATCNVIWG